MKGWVHRCYGGPEILQFEDLAKPVAEDDAVIVKVRAASVNPLDWHTMRGKPYFMRMDAGIGAPTESAVRRGLRRRGRVGGQERHEVQTRRRSFRRTRRRVLASTCA